jgi:hypothetical protein
VRTAPSPDQREAFFTITHPFHPWHGRRFELIERRRRWGQWRVYYLNERGHLAYFPASWTDAGPKDPFIEQARGRALCRVEDLLALVKMASGSVKEIKPNV